MQDEDVKCVKVPILKPRLTNEVPELEKKERGLGVVFFISCCSKEADTNLNNYDLRQSERDRMNKQTSHKKPIPNHSSNHTHIVNYYYCKCYTRLPSSAFHGEERINKFAKK